MRRHVSHAHGFALVRTRLCSMIRRLTKQDFTRGYQFALESLTLPRSGSRVRAPSPAPNFFWQRSRFRERASTLVCTCRGRGPPVVHRSKFLSGRWLARVRLRLLVSFCLWYQNRRAGSTDSRLGYVRLAVVPRTRMSYRRFIACLAMPQRLTAFEILRCLDIPCAFRSRRCNASQKRTDCSLVLD